MFSEVKGNPINNNNNNNNNKNKNNNNNSKLEFIFQVLVSIILLYNTINKNNEISLIENFYKNSFLILSTTINICYQFFIKFNFTSKNLHSRSHKNNNDDNKLLVERQQSDWGLGLGISLIPNILLVILLTLNNNNNNNNNNYFTIISLYQISLSIISPLFLFNHINTYRNSKIWKPSSSSSHQPSLTKKEYTNFIIIFLITLIISFTIFFDNEINFNNLKLTLFLFLLSFIFLVITKQLLYKLPNSFTIGEASIISQIITILLSESIRYFYNLFINNNNNNNNNDNSINKFSRINILYCFYSLIVGSLFIVFLNSLFNVAKSLRKLMTDYNNNNNNNNLIKNIIIKSSLFYFLVIFIIVGIIYPVLSYQLNGENPFIWVFEYIGSSDRIKYTIGLWMVLLVFTIFSYQPTIHSSIPMIISRKYFHILAIVMFTPPLLLEGDDDMYKFMVLSYSVSISALILLELLKYSLAPPLALPIRHYMDRFLDDRDSGLITTTHIYLLLGCSIPLFLTFFMDLIHLGSSGIQSNSYHFLSPFSGILTIGIGDTMASYFGVKYGRNKWFGSQKSIEGTVAGSIFTIIASLLLYWFCSASGSSLTISSILKIIVTSTSCSLMEASTTQIDNLILPLFYFTLINL